MAAQKFNSRAEFSAYIERVPPGLSLSQRMDLHADKLQAIADNREFVHGKVMDQYMVTLFRDMAECMREIRR